MSEFKLPKRPVKTNTSNDFDSIRSGISKLDEFDYAWKDYAEKCERGLKKAIKHIEEIERENNLLKVDSMPKQLVEVPQFVADWYEESKFDLDYSIWQYFKFWDSHEKDGFYYFMDNGGLKPVQTLIRMRFEGYTVKKEASPEIIHSAKSESSSIWDEQNLSSVYTIDKIIILVDKYDHVEYRVLSSELSSEAIPLCYIDFTTSNGAMLSEQTWDWDNEPKHFTLNKAKLNYEPLLHKYKLIGK